MASQRNVIKLRMRVQVGMITHSRSAETAKGLVQSSRSMLSAQGVLRMIHTSINEYFLRLSPAVRLDWQAHRCAARLPAAWDNQFADACAQRHTRTTHRILRVAAADK